MIPNGLITVGKIIIKAIIIIISPPQATDLASYRQILLFEYCYYNSGYEYWYMCMGGSVRLSLSRESIESDLGL